MNGSSTSFCFSPFPFPAPQTSFLHLFYILHATFYMLLALYITHNVSATRFSLTEQTDTSCIVMLQKPETIVRAYLNLTCTCIKGTKDRPQSTEYVQQTLYLRKTEVDKRRMKEHEEKDCKYLQSVVSSEIQSQPVGYDPHSYPAVEYAVYNVQAMHGVFFFVQRQVGYVAIYIYFSPQIALLKLFFTLSLPFSSFHLSDILDLFAFL